jgi:hypothetical protein
MWKKMDGRYRNSIKQWVEDFVSTHKEYESDDIDWFCRSYAKRKDIWVKKGIEALNTAQDIVDKYPGFFVWVRFTINPSDIKGVIPNRKEDFSFRNVVTPPTLCIARFPYRPCREEKEQHITIDNYSYQLFYCQRIDKDGYCDRYVSILGKRIEGTIS